MFAFLPAAAPSPRGRHKSHEIWHKGRQAVKDRPGWNLRSDRDQVVLSGAVISIAGGLNHGAKPEVHALE
jgi:hypothetical protein